LKNSLLKRYRLTSSNLIIRGITLGGKFIFIIFLAKHLTTDQLGEWGIFTTSIALSLYLVGLDFYTFSTRNLLEFPMERRGAMLRDQLIFYLLGYLILFPLLYLLFYFDVMTAKYVLFFYIILVLEHFAQETYRIFVVFSKPVVANVILFLRTGSWAYLLVFLWMGGVEDVKNLKFAFLFWMGGGIAAMLTSLYFLTRLGLTIPRKTPVNWAWIRQGIQISMIFFVATIAFKIIELADRYFIDHYHGTEAVGIYTFYANMANLIEIIGHTAVVIIFSPKLIEYFHTSNKHYRFTHAGFAKNMVMFTLLGGLFLALTIYPILSFLNKDEFFAELDVFAVMCLSEMLFNFSLIFHYVLYVRKRDKSIVWATIIAAILNLVLNFLLVPPYGIMGSAIATLASMFTIAFLKVALSRDVPETRQIILLKFLRKKKRKAV
jgi:O-antigen/teichoic acid export membrane protein